MLIANKICIICGKEAHNNKLLPEPLCLHHYNMAMLQIDVKRMQTFDVFLQNHGITRNNILKFRRKRNE